jgi:hypothetical protein
MAPITKIVGNKALLWSIAALTEIDVVVAEVSGDHLRYDFLIILDGGTYKRVQSKHARLDATASSVVFNAASLNTYKYTTGKTLRNNYRGDAEFFVSYNEYTKKSYLIPVKDVGISSVRLRLKPTRNRQEAGIRWAKDYEITPENRAKIISMIHSTPFSARNALPALPAQIEGSNTTSPPMCVAAEASTLSSSPDLPP